MQQRVFNPQGVIAISEVLAVFFAGSLLAQMLFQLAGVTGHPLVALMGENPDMVNIAIDLTKLLLLQFSGWFLLLVLFTLLNRQKIKAQLKLTKHNRTLLQLVIVGLIAWCVGDIANKLVFIIDETYNLGVSAPWREALLEGEKTAGWWLVMFVGSFGLIPILEEVFWRGYVQSKLMNAFSPSVAIVITATLFVFSHAQYHQLDLYHSATLVALSISALGLGWITYKTKSIVPAIVMHALLNFPTDGMFTLVVIGMMIGVSVWQWNSIKAFCYDFFSRESLLSVSLFSASLMLISSLAMLALSQAPQFIIAIGSVCFVIAFVASVIGFVKYKHKAKH